MADPLSGCRGAAAGHALLLGVILDKMYWGNEVIDQKALFRPLLLPLSFSLSLLLPDAMACWPGRETWAELLTPSIRRISGAGVRGSTNLAAPCSKAAAVTGREVYYQVRSVCLTIALTVLVPGSGGTIAEGPSSSFCSSSPPSIPASIYRIQFHD